MTAQAAPDYFYIFYRTFIYSAPTEPKEKTPRERRGTKSGILPYTEALTTVFFRIQICISVVDCPWHPTQPRTLWYFNAWLLLYLYLLVYGSQSSQKHPGHSLSFSFLFFLSSILTCCLATF